MISKLASSFLLLLSTFMMAVPVNAGELCLQHDFNNCTAGGSDCLQEHNEFKIPGQVTSFTCKNIIGPKGKGEFNPFMWFEDEFPDRFEGDPTKTWMCDPNVTVEKTHSKESGAAGTAFVYIWSSTTGGPNDIRIECTCEYAGMELPPPAADSSSMASSSVTGESAHEEL